MAELTAPACGLCRFWHEPEADALGNDLGPGECRHRSPRAVEDRRSGAWRSQWPPLWRGEWCGCFRPCEGPEPEESPR
jgi:hypothetical protein